jgi:threonylcarbamoyladenosine tRNA methylthiotransferase MtaB
MPQVPHPIRKERAARLREAGNQELAQFLTKMVGQEVVAMVEKKNLARTENFANIILDDIISDNQFNPGELIKLKVSGSTAKELIGRQFYG